MTLSNSGYKSRFWQIMILNELLHMVIELTANTQDEGIIENFII